MGHHFTSYSRADAADFAFRLREALRSGSPPFALWLDVKDLRPGIDWRLQIDDAIRNCDSFLFVMSRDSVKGSTQTRQEWQRALMCKRHVVPILLHPGIVIPFGLEGLHYVDFTGEFGPAVERLREHLHWLDSPEGQLYQLRWRLDDARRDLSRVEDPNERSRIEAEIFDLDKEVAALEQTVDHLEHAQDRADENIDRGMERERRPAEPVTVRRRTKFINRRPGVAPSYFQDRYVETKLIRAFLQDDALCLMTIVGRAGVGKTALACRLLRALEGGQLPDDLGEMPVDGIVYLSAKGSREIKVPNLYADLCKLLPDDAAEELDTLYKDPNVSTKEKMRALLAAFPEGRNVVLLDNFEDLVDSKTREITSPEVAEALQALLEVPDHAVKVILTTRVTPRALALARPERQMALLLDKGLQSPYAENILREMDADGKLGLKQAPETLLAKARERTLGYPRALEALVAILKADRHTSLEELLEDAEKPLPENVVQGLVGEAFSRLDRSARMAMQALAVYGRPVPAVAVDYLLQPYVIAVGSAPVLNRLVNMQFVRKEARLYYLHPVDGAYALDRVPMGERTDWREEGKPPFTQLALRHRGADYFKEVRKPREDWETIDDLAPQLAEFDLRFAAEEYDTAAEVIEVIDREYLWLWGHAGLVVQMRERLRGRLTRGELRMWNAGALAWSYWTMGRFEESMLQYDEAIRLATQSGDWINRAVFQHNKGLVHWDSGELAEALELMNQAAPAFEKYGSGENQAASLGDRGIVHMDLCDLRVAIDSFRRAEKLAGQVQAYRIQADNRQNLACGHLLMRDLDEARKWADLALQIPIDRVGHFNTSYSLVTRARVLVMQGEYRDAIEDCKAAIDLKQPSLRYRAALYMAIAHLALVDSKAALQNARQVVEWTRPLLSRAKCGRDAHYFTGTALLCAGQAQEALEAYQKGLAVCGADGVVRNVLLDLFVLGSLPKAPTGTADAVALLEASLPGSASGHTTIG